MPLSKYNFRSLKHYFATRKSWILLSSHGMGVIIVNQLTKPDPLADCFTLDALPAASPPFATDSWDQFFSCWQFSSDSPCPARWFGRLFYAECPPCRNPAHLLGTRGGLRRCWVPGWIWRMGPNRLFCYQPLVVVGPWLCLVKPSLFCLSCYWLKYRSSAKGQPAMGYAPGIGVFGVLARNRTPNLSGVIQEFTPLSYTVHHWIARQETSQVKSLISGMAALYSSRIVLHSWASASSKPKF